MKIYISGPMTGHEDNNRAAFNRLAGRITHHGHVAINPAVLPDGLTQREYMNIDMAMLSVSDAIIMLPGWQASAGATAEYHYAYKVGMTIFTEESLPRVV
jgi:predicted Rossmann-fold nucleotide-binding protein